VRLALAVLALLVLLPGAAPAADAAPVPATPAPPATQTAERLGLSLDSKKPMSIQAQELEAVRDPNGGEQVVFQNAVEVVQGDLRIDCGWLEARYGADRSGGPERITARGDVRIRQPGVEVRCDEAVFERAAQRAVCRRGGEGASLRRGDDVVVGREIEFDLARSVFRVRGGATVTIEPKSATP
jgi:lipopolysaccharide export system protein LptA